MRNLTLTLLLACCVACGRDAKLVVVNRLARGDGGMGVTDRPQLDILVRLEADATGFDPGDLMRVVLDDVDRTDEVVIGGPYALLRIDPAPAGPVFVELFRRTGPVLDTFTWTATPFAGPTLDSVSPPSARTGAQVTINGAGLSGGMLRVFFGGEEGSVDASTDTTITATVPAGALPGLVWVLVGDEAAEGVVEFQPLDGMDAPIPAPTGIRVFAVFPANADAEAAVQVYGLNFTNQARPVFNDRTSTRLFHVETVTLPLVGDVLSAFAVAEPETPPGAGEFLLDEAFVRSNPLPFTVNP